MQTQRASETRSPMQALHQSDWDSLYLLAQANRVQLSLTSFCQALTAIGDRLLQPNATRTQQLAFYRQLHLEDLALAQSCSLGNSHAWEQFVTRFDRELYGAALSIAKNESVAKDLSDSLAGDIFFAKIATYSGRGSLEGWLKALLTHAYIDHYRVRQRTVSLDSRLDLLKTLCANQETSLPQPDPRLHAAVEEAFAQRTPEERFLLSVYFFDSWTLAEIGRATGVHESSVSRRLNRIVKQLRAAVSGKLRTAGMTNVQIEESFTSGILDLSVDLRELLTRGLVRE
jgi:RNA polymerase sigma factor (sigma-70 family)